jgi:sugar transferase (PEP-CTERM system associated)
MIRLLHIYLPARMVLLVACELLVIGLGFLGASTLGTPFGSSAAGLYALGVGKVIVVVAVFAVCMWYFDLYDPLVITSRREISARMPQVFGWATLALIVLYRIFPVLHLGAFNFLLGMTTGGLLLMTCREGFLWLIKSRAMARNVVVLGDGTLARCLIDEITERPELGLHVVGRLHFSGSWKLDGHPGFTANSLSEAIAALNASIIILALQDRRGQLPLLELLSLKIKGVRIEDGVETYERVCGKLSVESLTPAALLFCKGFAPSNSYRVVKHVVSVALAIFGLLLLWPLMIVVAIAVKLSSPGPVFLRQERVGEDGRSFIIYKFRSMRQDAESASGPQWAKEADKRITTVGRIIRRCRIDELPQFFNILKGEMDLIGPRPERPYFVEQLRRDIPFYDQRHILKPGITGWAQLKFGYADSTATSMEKLQYDLYYVKQLSVGLDLVILLLTIKTVLFGRERVVRKPLLSTPEMTVRKESNAIGSVS